jgi:hypothetical protein
MARSKFSNGDTVRFISVWYPGHPHHRGIVVGYRVTHYETTRARRIDSRLNYKVQCECGAMLYPKAEHMMLLSTPIDAPPEDILVSRYQYFLRMIGVPGDQEDLKSQTRSVLKPLKKRTRDIIEQRFGLDGGDKKSLQTIAETLCVTKQNIQEIERRAIKKLQRIANEN